MNPHVLDITGILLALIFAATMFYHGHMIFHQKNGYSQKDEKKDGGTLGGSQPGNKQKRKDQCWTCPSCHCVNSYVEC